MGSASAGFGEVEVSSQVLGYRRHELRSERLLEQVDLDLPARVFRTEGLWLALPAETALELAREGEDVLGAIHAVEHALSRAGAAPRDVRPLRPGRREPSPPPGP